MRFNQLDGLRAIAVIAVVVYHTFGMSNGLGEIGVRLFFAISGFLITLNLLKCRDDNFKQTIKTFYVRRCLRIFPLYYFSLLICFLLQLPEFNKLWAWAITYTTNIEMLMNTQWEQGALSHFWSLAVEEQFYLIWPWVILLVPRRWLSDVLIGTIFLGVVFRYVAFSQTSHMGVLYQVPACADSLGMGALIALRNKKVSLTFSLSGMLIVRSAFAFEIVSECIYHTFEPFVESLLAVSLIQIALENRQNTFGQLLQLKPIVYIGTISYGIYVWHGILTHVLKMPYGAYQFSVITLLSIGLATLTWYGFEKKINDMRHRFSYR